jgi:uncharacterized protein YecT (DUF1311 family)
MPGKQRKTLLEYTRAAKNLELGEVCINVLETMDGTVPMLCVAKLKQSQQAWLKKLDAAAEKLGAPYGS